MKHIHFIIIFMLILGSSSVHASAMRKKSRIAIKISQPVKPTKVYSYPTYPLSKEIKEKPTTSTKIETQ